VAFETGQIVGDYEVLGPLGSGGMGCVYRVRNVISNRVEAMKALQSDLDAEPELAARFSAEIRTLATFDHPNIAQLRTAFQFGDQQLMIMELVEGTTLAERARCSAIPQDEVIAIVLQILSALSYAHARGVVHRDIKPANVMVTTGGNVKLMDFGIAKSSSEKHLTQPGTTMGSFYYMSPEQVSGSIVDPRSDLYSVGILLYEFLSGRRPFQAETTHALLNQQLNESPQPPIEINPHLPRELSDLILMAMEKEPGRRFRTADAFARALRSIPAQAVQAGHVPIATRSPAGPDARAFVNSTVGVTQTAFPNRQAEAPDHAPPSPAPQPYFPPAAQRGHRSFWILVGALAVLSVFAAALTLGPRFFRTAAVSKDERQTATVLQSAPAASTAPAPEPAVREPASGTTEPARQLAVASGRAEPTVMAPRHTATSERKHVAVQKQTTIPDSEAPSRAVPAPPPQPAPAAPSGPSEEEVAQAQEDLVKLNSRASAVSGSLERLQQEQGADGLGLRHDIAGAYSRMGTYLHASNADLMQRNLVAAHKHMDMAEKEISTLESFFNK
jgi:eukaryotic-like serine/threonine-protein kinase